MYLTILLTCLSSQAVSQQNCKLRIVKPQVNVKTKQKNVGAKITIWKIQQKISIVICYFEYFHTDNLKSLKMFGSMCPLPQVQTSDRNLYQKQIKEMIKRNIFC